MIRLVFGAQISRNFKFTACLLCSLLCVAPSSGAIAQSSPTPSNDVAPDVVLWNTIKDLQVPSLVERFIKQYPNSAYRPAAEQKLEAFTSTAAALPKSDAVAPLSDGTRQLAPQMLASKPVIEAIAAPTQPFVDRGLVVNTQFELKRLGCYTGSIDAIYGSATKGAVRRFMHRTNAQMAVDVPSEALLDALRRANGKICPVIAAIPSPMRPSQISAAPHETNPVKGEQKNRIATTSSATAAPKTTSASDWDTVFRQDGGGGGGGGW